MITRVLPATAANAPAGPRGVRPALLMRRVQNFVATFRDGGNSTANEPVAPRVGGERIDITTLAAGGDEVLMSQDR